MLMGTNAKLEAIFASIGPLDREAAEKTRARLDHLSKPTGSLGRLEELAIRLAGMTGMVFPPDAKKAVVVMAADHGVTAEGVSAYPQEVTAQMVDNFLDGGAAINILARQVGAKVQVVDLGVAAALDRSGIVHSKVRCGTGNFARERAMSRSEVETALLTGVTLARAAAAEGTRLLATGEMGIGNTCASSAVAAALTGLPVTELVGRGTGLDEAGLARKRMVVTQALSRHAPNPKDPLEVLEKVGGLEIAGLAGLILGGASCRLPVILDGFISAAAALVAVRLCPAALPYLIPSHLSAEPGHALILEYLGLKPYLYLEMCLGEGTGAVLAMQLVEAVARCMAEMATFREAGISDREEEEPAGVPLPGATWSDRGE